MEVIPAIRKIKATPKREGREIFPSTWEDQRNTFGDGIGPGSHGTGRIQKHRDGMGGGWQKGRGDGHGASGPYRREGGWCS